MSTASALWPSLLPPDLHGRDDMCAVSAKGTRVTFADGVTRLCGTSGLWNVNLGYGNEVIADAVGAALRSASYLTVFRYENRYAREAADALVEVCGRDRYRRVLFSTSGGAANDLVMKIARQYDEARAVGRPRKVIVGLRGSFHGLTFGGYALTGEDMGQRVNGVDQRLIRHLPPNDTEQLAALFARHGGQIVAVVVEPVLGTGAIPLSEEYVGELLRLRDEHGFLLVADEVATGFGRTGRWFASEEWPAPPDVLIVSKGLTNGSAPAAAVLVAEPVASAFVRAGAFPMHAETQAGTPPSCAAILATIEQMGKLDAIEAGARLSTLLDEKLAGLLARRPDVSDVTGRGCFRSLRVQDLEGCPLPQHEVPALVASVRAEGSIVHPGLHGVQLVPALVYTAEEVDELLAATERGLDRYRSRQTAPPRDP